MDGEESTDKPDKPWYFKKGNPGGPGRKKGTKDSLKARIKRFLRETQWASQDGRMVDGFEALVETTCRKAIEGDDRFTKIVVGVIAPPQHYNKTSVTVNNITSGQVRDVLDKIQLSPQLESRINGNGNGSMNGNGHASNGH